ncbi:MAG: adenine phosphoribosyltransferase [Rubrobacter sp.]|nr:adenine phosphoribosyltransferase [Rubrobacter sp.]
MSDAPDSPAEPSAAERTRGFIRTVPDFPKPGISYKDITPLIEDGDAMRSAVDALASAIEAAGIEYDRIVSAEARGFVFGTALAYRARKGLVLARKPGKLPRETVSASYELEYGTDSLEAHSDSIPPGSSILVADDLLATGGTARAMCQLVENAGGTVAGAAFIIELGYLGGRSLLGPRKTVSLINYDDPSE